MSSSPYSNRSSRTLILLLPILLILLLVLSMASISFAKPNDKPCETKITDVNSDPTEEVYALNPELTPEEKDNCIRQVEETLAQATDMKLVPGQLIVRFKENVGRQRQEEVLASLPEVAVQKVMPQLNAVVLTVPLGREVAMQHSLSMRLDVLYAEPNAYAFASPVEVSNASTGTGSEWGLNSIGAREAQSVVATEGTTVTVAVIDTGVSSHSELPRVTSGYNFVSDTLDTRDDNGHGSHVAGTVAGLTVGVCDGCPVVAYKVLNSQGSGTFDDIASAIISATQQSDVRVIVMSLGGMSDSLIIEEALSQAQAAGKLVVVASGNNLGQYPSYPARENAVNNLLAVGALDEHMMLTFWSSRFLGYESQGIVAPGSRIRSVDYACTTCYVSYSGTSMAAPHVAGAAALLMTHNPSLTYSEVKALLTSNALELGDAQEYGNGMLHIGKTLKSYVGATYDMPPLAAWNIPGGILHEVGESTRFYARPLDPDGSVLGGLVRVHTPNGSVTEVPLVSYNTEVNMWETEPVTLNSVGIHTVTVAATSGDTTTWSTASRNIEVVALGKPSGWPQVYDTPNAMQDMSHVSIDFSTKSQLFYKDGGTTGNQESVVVLHGLADVPKAVRVVSSAGCVTGNNYGRRYNFDANHGVYSSYAKLHTTAREFSCEQGIGMFGATAAYNESGLYNTLDRGSGESYSQLSRLHGMDHFGNHYWIKQLEGDYLNPPRLSADGYRLYTTDSMYDGMAAYNALTGELLWTFNPGTMGVWVEAVPAEHNGVLYIKVYGYDANAGMYALDPRTGSVIWHYKGTENYYDSSAVVVTSDGTKVLTCANSAYLMSWDASNGSLLWKTQVGDSYCDSAPVVSGNVVYQYASQPDNTVALLKLDLATGQLLDQVTVANYGSAVCTPIVIGSYIFQCDYDGEINAYSTDTLDQVWTEDLDVGGSNWQLSAAQADGYVILYVNTNNGYLRGYRFCITGSAGCTVVTPTPLVTNTPTLAPTSTVTPTRTPTATPTPRGKKK